MTTFNQKIGHDSLENPVLGIGTARDKSSYSFYSESGILDQAQLGNMYRTCWLAKRVVDTVADDMTRAWRTLTNVDELTAQQVTQHEERLTLRRCINDAIRWSRLYGGSLIYMGIRGLDPSKPLHLEQVRQGDLEYLHVLDRWQVDTNDQPLYTGPRSLFFGLPEYYRLRHNGQLIHCTHMLRLCGESLPSTMRYAQAMWDESILQPITASIIRYETVCATLATMMTEANIDVIQIHNLGEMLLHDASGALIERRLEELACRKSVNRTLILDTEEKYDKRSTNFQNLDNILNVFMCDVCGASDMPFTRLFGQSATGLHATGDNDIRQYYDMIAAKQERCLRPVLAYFDSVLMRSIFNTPTSSMSFYFNPLWQMNHVEKAKVETMKKEDEDNSTS